MRNRVVVALEWFWAYLTYHPSTPLITGDIPGTAPVPARIIDRRFFTAKGDW